jgi:uncharacterized protein DUF6152
MKSVGKVVFAGLAIMGCFLSIQPAVAHHSGAEFGDQVREITGTIKEFQFKNPHTWIQLMVDNPKGEKEEWSVEWGSPNQLARQGFRPSTFPAGAKVTLRIRQMRNGAPAGGFVGAKFPDGKTVGRWE